MTTLRKTRDMLFQSYDQRLISEEELIIVSLFATRLTVATQQTFTFDNTYPGGGGGVLPEKLGRGVRPASQNPYPIYGQNLRFSLPYL